MEKELTLFEEKRKLPHWIMHLFILANAGKYRNKHIFYSDIKKPLLEKHGVVCGHDLQRIEIKCRTCDGSGWWNYGEPCWNCHNGIYDIRQYYLLVYKLDSTIFNQKVHSGIFHIPVDFKVAIRYKRISEFYGKVKHPIVNNRKANLAFAILLILNNPNKWFIIFIKGSLKTMHRKAIKTIQHIHWKLKINKYPVDDLPF